MKEVVSECGIVEVCSIDKNRVFRSEASGLNAITGSALLVPYGSPDDPGSQDT